MDELALYPTVVRTYAGLSEGRAGPESRVTLLYVDELLLMAPNNGTT